MRDGTREPSHAVLAALEQLRRAVIADEVSQHPEIAGHTRLVRRVLSGVWDRHDPDGSQMSWTFQPFTVCQLRMLTISGGDGWTVRALRIGSEMVSRDVPASSFPPLPEVFARLAELDSRSGVLPAMTIGELRDVIQTIDRWFENLENLPRMTVQPGIMVRVDLEPPKRCSARHMMTNRPCQLLEGHTGECVLSESAPARMAGPPTPPALALHVVQLRDA